MHDSRDNRPYKQLSESSLVFLLYLFLRLITEGSAWSEVVSCRPDAVAWYAWRGRMATDTGSEAGRASEARRLLVVSGRGRGCGGLEVASCRGAPPRQLER